MSRGGIIIQNRADGRGMMLPEREGSGTFNKLPFVSMSCPKEEIGINPISTNKIIKTRKINPIIKRDRKREIEDKLYPLEKYRQLKTAQQFWKKNENPIYKEYNKNNAFQMFNKNIVKKEENKNANKEAINKEKEEVGNLSLKIKTPQKLKPLINKTTINAKRKIFDERKNDETPETKFKEVKDIKEIKEVKEEKNEKKVENNNCNDNDNKIENKENKDNKESNEEDMKEKIDPLLDDDLNENENIEDVINYLNGLDYDKYCKDMEIREALTLLKNKIDKEKEEKDKEEEKNKNKVTVEGVEQNEEAEKKEEEEKDDNNEENKDNKQLILPEINKKISEQKPVEIVNEEELKRKEEIKKYKFAEQIAKTDQMKAVHSVNSIRKLLQREGLDKVEEVAPLRITVIKDNPIANSDEYQANKLPFLHSLPLV